MHQQNWTFLHWRQQISSSVTGLYFEKIWFGLLNQTSSSFQRTTVQRKQQHLHYAANHIAAQKQHLL